MSIIKAYEAAKEYYAQIGVDTEQAIAAVDSIPLSMHCWQGDDITGFESSGEALSGGIQVTGNHPGKARTPDELRADLSKALSYIPGTNKINIHASYLEADGKADRNAIEPKHFDNWADWAIDKKIGLDFNPTFFSHPLSANGYTLACADDKIRAFWVEHGIRSRKVANYLGKKTGVLCLNNIWIPDGEKEVPVDTLSPRLRLIDSLDRMMAEKMDESYHMDSVECKLFGIGSESYVAGSHEFYMGYAMKNNILLTLDVGHFHPTETVSAKISAILPFVRGILLHVSRPVRWDSDHVVAFDEETRAIMREIVRIGALDKVYIATDYFDASVNRVIALATGGRNTKKALLEALLQPVETLKAVETSGNLGKRLAMTEELKTMPFGAVWDYYCTTKEVQTGMKWIDDAVKYETDVLFKR